MKHESIVGIGIDLVEIVRIRNAVRRWGDRFVTKVFVEEERAYCAKRARPWLHYAGRFAVKEAVAKALGTGIGVGARLNWLDIEVLPNHDEGAPLVRFRPGAEHIRRERGVGRVLISLSHAHDYVVAQAVLMSE